MNVEVTQKADGWMLGTIEGGYEWQAKVYEKPSEFGINGGRVSKLFIRPVGLGWQPALISYDRGWDIDAGQRPCPSNGGRERVSDHHQAEQMSRNRPARAVCRG